MELFAIYDHLGEFYETPFFAHNREHAERGISDLCHFQGNHPIVLHSGDYSLCHLGSFEPNSGTFCISEQPVFLNRCSAYMPKEQGAAVGDAIPPKQQSDQELAEADADNIVTPACDV